MALAHGGGEAAIGEQLRALVSHRLDGELSACERLTGGASQEMWAFNARRAGNEERFVLRRQSASGLGDRLETAGLDAEARVTQAVAAMGVPVAEIVAMLRPEDGLGEGFIARFVEGEALGNKLVNDKRFSHMKMRLTEQCGAIMAHIHSCDLALLPLLARRTARESITQLRAQLHSMKHSRPLFEAALHWLDDNCPEPVQPRLVHGDFRTGNFLVDDDGLAAVLDWENVHLGDPMEDVGWFCMPSWRYRRLDLPAGGFGSRQALFAAYEAAGGGEVDRERVRFWEVRGILRWGLTCMAMAETFESAERTLERAAIGRRSSEAEYELALAMGWMDPDA